MEPTLDGLSLTGNPTIDALIQLVGAVYIALTMLHVVLPKNWRVSKIVAKFAADIKGLLSKTDSDRPTKPGGPTTMLCLGIGLSLCLPATQSCAAMQKAVPVVANIVNRVIAEMQRIDAVTSETFRLYPETPAEYRQRYVAAFDATMAAALAFQKVAEGAEDLNSADSMAAFAKFKESYEDLLALLKERDIVSAAGQLMLDGNVVGAVQPASSFRQ